MKKHTVHLRGDGGSVCGRVDLTGAVVNDRTIVTCSLCLKAAEVWVTYRRRFTTVHGIITKLSSESHPMGYPESRPATKDEIGVEKTRRAELYTKNEARRQFTERQDYKDAQSIRGTIEMMDCDNHVLDNLTPEEWAALRQRICGH